MKGKKLLAIVLSLALLVPFAVSKPAQASSYENVMGLWQMDCDEEYVRPPTSSHRTTSFLKSSIKTVTKLPAISIFPPANRQGVSGPGKTV